MQWIKAELPEDTLSRIEHHENSRIAVLQCKRFIVDTYRPQCFLFAISTRFSHTVTIGTEKRDIPEGTFLLLNPGQEHRPPESESAEGMYLIPVNAPFFRTLNRRLFPNAAEPVQNGPFPVTKNSLDLIAAFLSESKDCNPGFLMARECIATLLIISLLRAIHPLDSRKPESRYGESIERAREYLQSSLGEPFSLEKVSRIAQLSPYYFSRVFRQHTGMTPYGYLVEQRIEQAKNLLEFSSLTVKEICFLSGFNNSSHFTSLFRKRSGMSPSEYRAACDRRTCPEPD